MVGAEKARAAPGHPIVYISRYGNEKESNRFHMTPSITQADQARTELYRVMNLDLSFDEKVEQALEIGRLFLGVENAHLTHIDLPTEHWEAVESTDPTDGQFPPGLVLDLNSTYCRRTIDRQESIALHDAGNQGWESDPAFESHSLSTYHGTPVMPNGGIYGTLCFVSEQPREEPFADGETMFAELIARMLEFELRRLDQQRELDRRSNLISVLNRVLRHNLRNDLNVIQGRVELLADQLDNGSDHVEGILLKTEALISVSEKVRSLELTSVSDFDRKETDVSNVIDGVVDDIKKQYTSISVTRDEPPDLTLEVFNGFEVVVGEVIENAAKHSGQEPEIHISVRVVPNALELTVSDNGPGIPAHEREVLQQGGETPLVHGSGFGLWMVYWLITGQEGTVDFSVGDGGTEVTLTIPRSPAGVELNTTDGNR